MFDYKLSLAAGTDIPIPECQITLYQPKLKDIALLGENTFFTAIQLLCLNKAMYLQEDDENITNFAVFMMIVNDPRMRQQAEDIKTVLSFLIPNSKIFFTQRAILVNKDGEIFNIDEGNFEIFQKVLQDMFCLTQTDHTSFNPKDKKAKEIAAKLMRGRERVAAQNKNESSTLGQYISILTVGLNSMSITDCINLTMYQMYSLIERYTMYINWDIDLRSRLAGAKADKPLDNWMKTKS